MACERAEWQLAALTSNKIWRHVAVRALQPREFIAHGKKGSRGFRHVICFQHAAMKR